MKQRVTVDLQLVQSLLTMATIIEARDAYTGGHTWRVSQYAKLLAKKLGLSSDEAFVASLGGLVHDIGKIGIPDNILNKPAVLTPEEFSIMRKHPAIGDKLISSHPLDRMVHSVVTEHHERPDGKGYPVGIRGETLSLLGKIVSIADAFDAMTSSRPYRVGMPAEKAYEILEEHAGTQFDGSFVASFISMGRSGDLNHVLGHSSEERQMGICPGCGPILVIPRKAEEGEQITCSHCRGVYTLENREGRLVPRWTHITDVTNVPEPDRETIELFISQTPEAIAVEI